MTTCEQIAAYVARARWNAISPEARDKLKQHLLDAIGCALGAMGSGPIAAIQAEEKSAGCSGPCSLIGGGSSSPERAAFHNSALTRYLDFMDAFIAKEEACHPSDNIGALLAAAELAKASGSDFLTAMAIAYHLQCRLISGDAPIMRGGFDHTLPLAIAIAGGCSYLLQLPAQTTAHAIALCANDGLSLGAARSGDHVPQWKGLAAPAAAFNAVHDIRLAQLGITGPLHAFEGPLGLQQVLGKPFGIDWEQQGYDGVLACSIKKFNVEFHAQSLIDCVLELRNSYRLQASDVRGVHVDIFKAGYEMIGGGKYVDADTVDTKEDADHSLPYLVAVALLDGDVWPEQFEAQRIRSKDVQDLMKRVESSESRLFTLRYPNSLRVRVRVKRTRGGPLEAQRDSYKGFFRDPMTWPELIQKFRRLGKHAASDEALTSIVECVRNLDKRPVSSLISLLAHVNHPA